MKKVLFICSSVIFATHILAWDGAKMKVWEDSLASIAPAILHGESEEERLAANQLFVATLKATLKEDGSFKHPFKGLETIAVLSASDGAFRMFNWNLPMDDGTFQYFGFIHYYSKKYKKYQVFELLDKSDELGDGDQKILGPKNWFGAHYYTLIGTKKKSKYYLLLGWDGNTRTSNKKIIDVLSFGKAGQPVFGKAVLGTPLGYKNRLVFEYAERAAMSVKFKPGEKTIVYDHLSSNTEATSGVASFQGPDGSVDALKFKRGKWHYIKDYDARNARKKKKDNYNDPE